MRLKNLIDFSFSCIISRNMKRVISFALALVWLGIANCCVVSQALALNSSGRGHSDRGASAHSCCPDRQGSNPKDTTPTHDPSSGKICCQLVLSSSQPDLKVPVPAAAAIPVFIPLVSSELQSFDRLSVVLNQSPIWTGPPENPRTHLISLSLASNAPPFTF